MTEKKLLAVGYTRVSTDEQADDDKTSLTTQREDIRAYCVKRGYEYVHTYEDKGISGTKRDRPEFQQMLQDGEAGKYQVIVCWKQDRLSRDSRPTADLLDVVESTGIQLEGVIEHVDTDTFGDQTAKGRKEHKDITIRTKRARDERARKKGLLPCGSWVPFGYQLILGETKRNEKGKLVKEDSRIEINPPEADWIRDMFQWLADGKTIMSWCLHATANGFVQRKITGKGITVTQAYRWLKNTCYYGDLVVNKTVWHDKKRLKVPADPITIPCPPIVSRELWQKAQDGIAHKVKFSTRHASHFYMLGGGLMECKYCGERLFGITSHGITYYTCYGTYRYHKQCRDPKAIRGDKLEREVWDRIVDTIDEYVSENNAVDRLLDVYERNRAGLHDKIVQEREGLSDISWKKQKIATLILQKHLTDNEGEFQYQLIEKEQNQHQEEIVKLEAMLDNGNLAKVRELIDRVNLLHREYNFGDFDSVPNTEKRAIVQQFVDKITVGDIIEIRLKVPNIEVVSDCLIGTTHSNKCV